MDFNVGIGQYDPYKTKPPKNPQGTFLTKVIFKGRVNGLGSCLSRAPITNWGRDTITDYFLCHPIFFVSFFIFK